MKYELNKGEIDAIFKAMAEYCRHQPDPMVASEQFRLLRIKLETQGIPEEPKKQDIPQTEEV